jgi:hypothetical protein
MTTCPYCRAPLDLSTAAPGALVTCPSCRRSFAAPRTSPAPSAPAPFNPASKTPLNPASPFDPAPSPSAPVGPMSGLQPSYRAGSGSTVALGQSQIVIGLLCAVLVLQVISLAMQVLWEVRLRRLSAGFESATEQFESSFGDSPSRTVPLR